MSLRYFTPTNTIEHLYEIKKSKFIARVTMIENRSAAMDFLQQAKADYPDARHYCWAYLLGSPQQPLSQAFNDDGEPSGTAGKPILNILNHGDIGDTMIIIIRYFGGIKLGAGGLVRAYSTASQQAIGLITTQEKVPMLQAHLQMDFSLENTCRHQLNLLQANIIKQQYDTGLNIEIKLPVQHSETLKCFCLARKIKLEMED